MLYKNGRHKRTEGSRAPHRSAKGSLRFFVGWDPRLPWLYPYIQKTHQKRKGGQIRFTNEQTDALEQKFGTHKYLSPQERKKLAKNLELSERQVNFQIVSFNCYCEREFRSEKHQQVRKQYLNCIKYPRIGLWVAKMWILR